MPHIQTLPVSQILEQNIYASFLKTPLKLDFKFIQAMPFFKSRVFKIVL